MLDLCVFEKYGQNNMWTNHTEFNVSSDSKTVFQSRASQVVL